MHFRYQSHWSTIVDEIDILSLMNIKGILPIVSYKVSLLPTRVISKHYQTARSSFTIYGREPLYCRPTQHDIENSTPVTEAKHTSEFVFTTDSPYFTLAGELWGVYCI